MRAPRAGLPPPSAKRHTLRNLYTAVAVTLLAVMGACTVPRLTAPAVTAPVAAPAMTNSGYVVDLNRAFADNSQLGDIFTPSYYTAGRYSWIWRVSLPRDRLILYYGNPLSPVLGPIGRYSDPDLVAKLRQQAQVYQALDPMHPAVPGFDYVTPVAQPDPMPDHTYTLRMPDDSIQHYVDLAMANHVLFFFDLQIGHSTVAREVDHLWKYLAQPGVNISLDPEFDMAPGDIPGVEFGRMYASEINAVIDRLSAVVASEHLPPKVLIVHWFRPGLVVDWQNIKLKPGVSVITSDDGVGPPGPKIDDYNLYDKQYLIQYPGIKIFYDLDKPVMSEREVLALSPQPVMVMYQ